MNEKSRVIRVFLSSTFRDFGEERDLLVKKVFPELRRLCRQRQVELVDVDLRWGITAEEAEQGKVLPICLGEIDRARPYFMGFIGDRYGWVPEESEYPEVVVEREPWLEEHQGGKSVTELEMLHGVLNNPEMAGRAFFYYRDTEYSKAKGGDYAAESPEHAAKLENLKERIRASKFPVEEDYPDPEALAELVRRDLQALIEEEYPKEEVPDTLTLERMRHEAYGAVRRRLYLGGRKYFKILDEAMEKAGEDARPLLVTGQSGVGKSALIANWVAGYREKHPETQIIIHHLSASAEAADPLRIVRRLIREITAVTGDTLEPESDPEKLLEQLPLALAMASSEAKKDDGGWLIVLDGLDMLTSRRHLRWFPRMLPAGVKLVASCAESDVLASLESRLDWERLEVALFSEKKCREFITEYLGRFRKTLPNDLVDRILAHPLVTNPLWLLTLLEELRLFGKHEEVEARLTTLLSPPPSKAEGEESTIDDLFEHVLARIEEDIDEDYEVEVFKALWASYDGLTRDELLDLTGMPPAKWSEIQTALDENLFEASGKIAFGNGFIRKAVEDRHLPSEEEQKAAHRWLGEWFDKREVTLNVAQERVHQWKQAGDRERFIACLLERDVFKLLHDDDEFALLTNWKELDEGKCFAVPLHEMIKLNLGEESQLSLGDLYQQAFYQWSDCDEVAFELAEFLYIAGDLGDFTEQLYRRAQAWSEKVFGLEHLNTLESINCLGVLLYCKGDHAGAESQYRRARAGSEKAFGREHPETLLLGHNLAVLMATDGVGRLEEAERLLRQTLERQEGVLGAVDLATLNSISSLGNLLIDKGNLDEAEKLLCRVLENREKILGAEHPDTLTSVLHLGRLLCLKGDLDEAEQLYRRVLSGSQKVFGMEHPNTLQSVCCLRDLLIDKGDYDEADRFSDIGYTFQITREKIKLSEASYPREMRHPTRIRKLEGFIKLPE